jgi:hypothetical protein
LTPSETINKAAKSVKAKVVEMDKGLKVSEETSIISGIVNSVVSALSGIKDNHRKKMFIGKIIEQLRKLEKGVSMKRAEDGMYLHNIEGSEVQDDISEMLKFNIVEVRHHADEIMEALKSGAEVEAWVLSRSDRAKTDMSDIAHYLDSSLKANTMADGGYMANERQTKYAIFDENTDRIYIRNTDKDFIEKKYKELKEVYPNDKLKIIQFDEAPDIKMKRVMASGGYMADGGKLYGEFKIKVEKWTSLYNKDANYVEVKVDKMGDGVPLKYVLQALVDFKDKAYLNKAFQDDAVVVYVKEYGRYHRLSSISKDTYDKYVDSIKNPKSEGDKMEFGGYMAKGGKLDIKKFREQYDENEDDNAHSENVVLLAEYFGTKQDVKDAKNILAKHEAIGSMPSDLMKKRDALHDKLWDVYKEKMSMGGEMAKRGRLLSAINRDRAYKSNEEWEKDYKRKGSPKSPKYKTSYAKGGQAPVKKYPMLSNMKTDLIN